MKTNKTRGLWMIIFGFMLGIGFMHLIGTEQIEEPGITVMRQCTNLMPDNWDEVPVMEVNLHELEVSILQNEGMGWFRTETVSHDNIMMLNTGFWHEGENTQHDFRYTLFMRNIGNGIVQIEAEHAIVLRGIIDGTEDPMLTPCNP